MVYLNNYSFIIVTRVRAERKAGSSSVALLSLVAKYTIAGPTQACIVLAVKLRTRFCAVVVCFGSPMHWPVVVVVVVEVLLYVHRNRRLIRDGSRGWSLRLSHNS